MDADWHGFARNPTHSRLCNFNLPHTAQCCFAFSPLSASLWMCILILPIANRNTICLFAFGIGLLCLQKYAFCGLLPCLLAKALVSHKSLPEALRHLSASNKTMNLSISLACCGQQQYFSYIGTKLSVGRKMIDSERKSLQARAQIVNIFGT